MTDDLPLFDAAPEPEGPYRVAGLGEHGSRQRGAWVAFWADAPRPLQGRQDQEAVMLALGFDPAQYKLYPAGPITGSGKQWRTWWHAWPNHLPSPGV